MYQRIFGELNITGIDVSHTKDDFKFGSIEDELIVKLKDEINKEEFPILSQAIHYRAKEFDIDQTGYRLLFNTNADAMQTIFHIHLHLIGGEKLKNI